MTVTASVTDPDSPIAGVEFRVDGALWFTDTMWPYTILLGNLTSGHHELTAVARDVDGLSKTSSPVVIEAIGESSLSTLVPNGAFWRYLDNGSDQGTNWHTHRNAAVAKPSRSGWKGVTHWQSPARAGSAAPCGWSFGHSRAPADGACVKLRHNRRHSNLGWCHRPATQI